MAFYKVRIEVTNKELLQAVLSGNISQEEAHEFKERMLKKKKRHGVMIAIFMTIFFLAFALMLLTRSDPGNIPAPVLYFMAIGLLFGPGFALWQFNGFYVAAKYLGALKKGYPNI